MENAEYRRLKLNIGCGKKVLPGFINLDKFPVNDQVKKWDLDKHPLPFKDNSVDYILFEHALVYLENRAELMHELHRICKKGAIIDLYETHFSFAFVHAELRHKRPGISGFTFGHFDKWNDEFKGKFKVKTKYNFQRKKQRWLNAFFNPLINGFPMIYERFFCYLFPCSQVHFRMQVVK